MFNFGYPATLVDNGEGRVIATFRDVPEAMTEGSREDIEGWAKDALITSIDFYLEERRSFPRPSKPLPGEILISLPPSVVAKVLLFNAMVEKNVRPVDLARLMHVKPQEVSRITDIRHSTKIDTLARALHAVGKELVIDVK